jgi:hypothetical protein
MENSPMTVNPVILAFDEVFNANPAIFDEYLQDLDQTLTELENQPIDAVSERLIDWYSDEQRFDKIGILILEEIQIRTDSFKQKNGIDRQEEPEDDTLIRNRMRQLRQAVTDRLQSQQQESQDQPLNDEKKSD